MHPVTSAHPANMLSPLVDASPAAAGVTRNRIGSSLLARQFSNGLDVGFVSCTFRGRECWPSDFQEVLHPQLGVCYRFVKEPLLRNLSLAEVAEAVLEVQLFTDATDSRGFRANVVKGLPNVILASAGDLKDSDAALNVLLVPDGMFPWSSQAHAVMPAHMMEFKLRYDKNTRYSKPPLQACSKERRGSITYVLDHWSPISGAVSDRITEKTSLEISRFDFSEPDWIRQVDTLKDWLRNSSGLKGPIKTRMKFAIATQEDCINESVLRRFAKSCGCLPTFLPIPEHLFDAYPICFNTSNLESLYLTDQCYIRQTRQLQSLRTEARKRCLPPCETRKFAVQQNSRPWPNLRSATALPFLKNLASQFGYPNQVRISRGPASIYSTYLRAEEGKLYKKQDPTFRLDTDDELTVLQDRLVKVSVSASDMFGEEVVEDEAYPVKNLLADMGGILGLWCGVSVLTVCELVELIVYLVLTLRHLLTRRGVKAPRSGGDGRAESQSRGTTTNGKKSAAAAAFEISVIPDAATSDIVTESSNL